MKTLYNFVIVCCASMALVASVLLVSSPVYADANLAYSHYGASSSIGVGNVGTGGGPYDLPATDLHVTYEVHDPETEWFTSWTISVTPPLPNEQVTKYYWQGRAQPYRIEVRYDPISVAHSSSVKVTIIAYLNTDLTTEVSCPNALKTAAVKWTYAGGSIVGVAAPDHGFDFPDAVYEGQEHSAVYNYYNYDSSVPITLSGLAFYQKSVWIAPDSQWSPSVLINPFHQEPGPFVLQPGDSISISLVALPNHRNSYIYVAGEMEYQMSDFDNQIVGFRHGHEELREGRAIPMLTEWGMIILVLLIGGTAWFIWRQRKNAAGVAA